MSDRQAQRHAAAMLVHQLGSGIDALSDMSPELAAENAEELHRCFMSLGTLLRKTATKNELLKIA